MANNCWEPAATASYARGAVVLFCLETRFQLDDQLSSCNVVRCDGNFLWRFQRLQGQGSLTRIDLAQVKRALEEAGRVDRFGQVGEWPAIGGLAKVLRGLQANFDFTDLQTTQWRGMPVWRLTGWWTRPRLAELLPGQRGAIAAGQAVDFSRLAEPLPHYVVLSVGGDDFFPYAIEYGRLPQKDKKGKVVGPARTITKLEFEVLPNAVPDRSLFTYKPSNMDEKDRTQEYIRELKLPR